MDMGAYKERTNQLSEAVSQANDELVPIEEVLGLPVPDDTQKVPTHSDLLQRLDTQVGRVASLACRLELVQKAVHRLKDAIG